MEHCLLIVGYIYCYGSWRNKPICAWRPPPQCLFWFPNPNLNTHQVDELADRDLTDGLLHAAQCLQRGPEAAGQVVPRNGDEVVFAPIQVQHQNVFNGVLSRIEEGDRVLADVNLQVDV